MQRRFQGPKGGMPKPPKPPSMKSSSAELSEPSEAAEPAAKSPFGDEVRNPGAVIGALRKKKAAKAAGY